MPLSTLALEPGIESLKSRLRTTWMAGDYDHFSRFMENDARSYYERLDVPPGARLLDVACGSRQLALIAAREGVRVTGVDIAENLIERAEARSVAEALPARFRVADAESLPFPDASFEVVVSLIGAMFAPRPHLVARELTRVCVPGGTIAMANWTAEGFVGKVFKTIAKFIAPSGMPSPLLWGDEAAVRERFGSQVRELRLERRHYTFDYPFPPSASSTSFGFTMGQRIALSLRSTALAERAFTRSWRRSGRRRIAGGMASQWSPPSTSRWSRLVLNTAAPR